MPQLNVGKRTYNFIKDFLTGKTAELMAGDLKAKEKRLGSTGTPQRSVILPLLFNLVMTRVAESLSRINAVKNMTYADDITLWVDRGSDAHIESAADNRRYDRRLP